MALSRFWEGPQGVERQQQLLALISKGFTHSQIADRLGTSRNAVIGKVFRLGQRLRGNKRLVTLAANGGVDYMVARRAQRLRMRRERERAEAKRKKQEQQEQQAPKVVTLRSLDSLTNRMCRYPMWEPGTPPEARLYCGALDADITAERPYCAEHAKLCLRPVMPRERRALRRL